MELITHQRTEEGFHEIVFSKACRASIEELTTLLENLYEDNNPNIYCLLDMRASGMLPLRYLTYQMRRLQTTYKNHYPIHLAIVLQDSLMLDVSMVLLRTIMRHDRAQYFTDIEKAHIWLRMHRDKARH
jgi:hypothetical protein